MTAPSTLENPSDYVRSLFLGLALLCGGDEEYERDGVRYYLLGSVLLSRKPRFLLAGIVADDGKNPDYQVRLYGIPSQARQAWAQLKRGGAIVFPPPRTEAHGLSTAEEETPSPPGAGAVPAEPAVQEAHPA